MPDGDDIPEAAPASLPGAESRDLKTAGLPVAWTTGRLPQGRPLLSRHDWRASGHIGAADPASIDAWFESSHASSFIHAAKPALGARMV